MIELVVGLDFGGPIEGCL